MFARLSPDGIQRLRDKLLSLAPEIRRKYVRKALRKGAEIVQKVSATPGIVPVLAKPVFRNGKMIRRPGTLQRNILIRNSRDATAEGNVGVFVNVRPAKGAKYSTTTNSLLGLKYKVRTMKRASQRGAKSPLDPYYWRFINFGTGKGVRAAKFLQAGAQALPAALDAFMRAIGPAFEKLNKPKAPAP